MSGVKDFTPDEFINFYKKNIETFPEEQHLAILKNIVPSFGNVENLQNSISYRIEALNKAKQQVDSILRSQDLNAGGWNLKNLQEQSADYTHKIITLNKMSELVRRHTSDLKQSGSKFVRRIERVSQDGRLFAKPEHTNAPEELLPLPNSKGKNIRNRKRLPRSGLSHD